MFRTNFLNPNEAVALVAEHGTPVFVYSTDALQSQADSILAIPAPYGMTIRYAMKANPHPDVLRVLRDRGIHIDASSGYEAALALEQGSQPSSILLTSQQLAHNLQELVKQGVQFTATSLRQLETYGSLFPGTSVGVRINPGIGSGHSSKTNVGGPTSSFGIWHEYIPRAHQLAEQYNLRIHRLHTHIGSGTDPDVWASAARTSLELVKHFPDVTILDLGGGFKVGRMDHEVGVDMVEVGRLIAAQISQFATDTGRQLHLEFEPGTFLAANAGILVSRVEDIVDTGAEGYTFLKLDTGMNDILRPSLYGAQHPIAIINDAAEVMEYALVGHNCESGDLLTPAPGNPESIWTRTLPKASVGDIVIIGGAGAYCASMAAHGYNSFPSAKQILI